MGVAGGELLIPAIVLIYGVDIRTAGSLSLLGVIPDLVLIPALAVALSISAVKLAHHD